MRALLPGPVDDVDVHAYYAAGWTDRGGLRANFVAAADGASAVNGKSAGLQTSGDNRVFAALRDLADVILVGAGTAVAEGYDAITLSAQRQSVRRRHGLAPTLPTAVVSRTLRLDPGQGLFTSTTAVNRTIVLTSEAADTATRTALEKHADVVVCGEETVEPARVRAALEERELARILLEGGPSTFAQFVAAEVVDELCLSVTPKLGGPGAGRITGGKDGWPVPIEVTLAGLLEEDGALFHRYLLPRTTG